MLRKASIKLFPARDFSPRTSTEKYSIKRDERKKYDDLIKTWNSRKKVIKNSKLIKFDWLPLDLHANQNFSGTRKKVELNFFTLKRKKKTRTNKEKSQESEAIMSLLKWIYYLLLIFCFHIMQVSIKLKQHSLNCFQQNKFLNFPASWTNKECSEPGKMYFFLLFFCWVFAKNSLLCAFQTSRS